MTTTLEAYMSGIIDRLRDMPTLLDKAPVRYSRTAAEKCQQAADLLEKVTAVLSECDDYFDDRADADQPSGQDYPTPNAEMRLLVAIRGLKP